MPHVEHGRDALKLYHVSCAALVARAIERGSKRDVLDGNTFLPTFPHLLVAVQAAALRAVNGIRLPDALILVSGLLAGCEAITTNAEQWQRRLSPLFREFRWLYLGDYC